MRVTVVIPAYKRTEALRRAVESVVAQDLPASEFELIVVDSSPDDANERLVATLARQAPCQVRCFRKKPEGPGPSRNLGAREGAGEFIAFMDSDCLASPGWLRHGLAAFAGGVGLVQGRTIPEAGVPTGIFTHYIRVEQESFLYETANMFYRREAFEETAGFTADLNPYAMTPMGGEDVHVAWTIKRNGWQSRFAPEALVMHEIVPISKWDWIFIKRLYIYPHMVGKFPEIRKQLFAGYFVDAPQALIVVALLLSSLAAFHAGFLFGWLPYLVRRASEPSKTLKGALRPLRALVYVSRDLCSLTVLIAGSIRYRNLVL
jgi:glycosyltransferase involved in cell wall biosynthesis